MTCTAPTPAVATKIGDLERICEQIDQIRQRAQEVETLARDVEDRLLGSTPCDPSGEVPPHPPHLAGVVGGTAQEIHESINQIGHSLDRIHGALGSVGSSGQQVKHPVPARPI